MGPTGTGKVQTVLKIIANLSFIEGKSGLVVSNNNEAVFNIIEKACDAKAGVKRLGAGRKKFCRVF